MYTRAEELPTDEFVEIQAGGGQPQISCLMPIFRQEAYVADAVTSVLNQQGIIVEIIISDDCSGDDTLSIALSTVNSYLADKHCEHRILLRRGGEQLRRDHLPLLVEQSSSDIVCQAHGDDLSHPARASILVEIFNARPGTNLLGVDFVTMDAHGSPRGEVVPISRPVPVAPYPINTLIRCPPELIGAVQAWRKSAVAGFGALTSSVAPVSHDRILPFRAALTGDVCSIRLHLVMRRMHGEMWGNDMNDPSSRQANRFSWCLARQTAYATMRRDLEKAVELGLVETDRAAAIGAELAKSNTDKVDEMLVLYGELYNSNLRVTWLDAIELAARSRLKS